MVGALNPVMLGVILLLLSRPRPLPSLFVYWLGLMTTNLPAMLIPLVLLHFVPGFRSFAEDLHPDQSPVVRYVLLGLGVLTLLIAVVVMVRPWVKGRERQGAATAGGRSVPKPLADAEIGAESSSGKALLEGLMSKNNAVIRRLASRLYDAWESDNLKIVFAFGMLTFIAPEAILFIDTAIVFSGNSIFVQLLAAVAFVLLAFAMFEIVLVGYWIAPAKARAVVEPIHERTRKYRRQILATLLILVGSWQVAMGLGVV
ncbi:GAP family protein [Mycolicibacterium insubricum]|nr:GAP family protein [Mycolicibacterium insubricum]